MARAVASGAGRLVACRDLAMGLGIPALAAAILPGPSALLTDLADPQPEVVLGAALLGIIAALAWALTAWGTTVVVMTLAGALPSRCGRVAQRVLRHIAPAAIRQTAAVAVGLSLTVGIAVPAYGAAPAAGAGSDATPPAAQAVADPAPSGSGGVLILDLDWGSPDPSAGLATPQPISAQEPTPATAPTRAQGRQGADSAPGRIISAADPARTVTVRAGDCLWALAASELPASATAAEIDAAWRAWYHANRRVIGPDPNILIPGQRLAVPTAPAASAAPSTPLPGGIR